MSSENKHTGPVLLSWIAVNNDPYDNCRGVLPAEAAGAELGPTLNLLFTEDSPYRGRVQDAVLLYRQPPRAPQTLESQVVELTRKEIRRRDGGIRVHSEVWRGEDPTDHRAIYEFLRGLVPKLRARYLGRELVIHVSPGTPSMQTIWVLMAETGLIEAPFVAVKSYRQRERQGLPPVVPVEVGLETFYKAYRAVRPRQVEGEEQALAWDPARFRSKQLRQLYKEARRFAPLKVPALILGERGTGKTTLASWIRLHSPYRQPRLDRSWPSVACGQYTGDTIRAELFGYRSGAFTGASSDREGLLHRADGDTLFLDEIADLGSDLQRMLIRALEEGRFLRLGSAEPERSDFRLLAATNQPWERLKERLNPDFMDRIGALRVRVPALREIPEDLEWIWEVVLVRAASRAGVPLPRPLPERLLVALRAHPLPGNLRDLFQVAWRLLAALTDPFEPSSPEEAVDFALAELEGGASAGDPHRALASCFALGAPLDALVSEDHPLDIGAFEGALQSWLAGELSRIARERGLSPAALCDRSERTLRSWKK